jgi:hypothetical protein
MNRAIVCALAGLSLLGLSPQAHADGWYFCEGLGGTRVKNDMGRYFDGTASGRLALGHRADRWAIEGFLMLTALDGKLAFAGDSYSAFSYGVDVRYLFPMNPHWSLYVRGGLNHMDLESTWYTSSGPSADGYAGRGLDYGAGIQVKGKVRALGLLFFPLFFADAGPKITMAGWLDTSHHFVRLHDSGGAPTLDGDLMTLSLGIAFGSDF